MAARQSGLVEGKKGSWMAKGRSEKSWCSSGRDAVCIDSTLGSNLPKKKIQTLVTLRLIVIGRPAALRTSKEASARSQDGVVMRAKAEHIKAIR